MPDDVRWRFPNRVRLAAALLPLVADDCVPKLLDACTKFRDPCLARTAAERGYRLIVCDIEPDEVGVNPVDITGRLPWKDGYFRGVICEDTLEHVPDMLGPLREFRRVIEKDGFLILHLPVAGGAEGWRETSEKLDPTASKHLHQWAPGVADVERCLDEAGFAVVGKVEGFDDERFRVCVMWLCRRS